MLRRLLLAVVLLVLARAEAVAAISISVVPSRISCTAPCAVDFDMTGTTGLSGTTHLASDYVSAEWTTNFGDPGSTHPTSIGFYCSHVFEAAGTYSVTISVKDSSGVTAGPTTTTITVTAMSGTTFFASSAGSGTTCSIGTPCSLTTALTHATTNNTVLIRNGDTFSGLSSITMSGVTGPTMIGGYSDPGAPSVVAPTLQFGSSAQFGFSGTVSDFRIKDIHIDQPNGGEGIDVSQATASNILILRTEITGAPSIVNAADCVLTSFHNTKIFVFDSHFHHFNGYAWFSGSPRQNSLVGTTIEDVTGQDHGFRWSGCEEVSPGVCAGSDLPGHLEYAAYNTIDDPTSFASASIRGDNTDIVVIGNHVNNHLAATPTDATTKEFIQNVLMDSNTLNAWDGTGLRNMVFAARHVVVRNNVFQNASVTVLLTPAAAMPIDWMTEIFIYNNTAYYPTTCTQHQATFAEWDETNVTSASTVKLQNNIYRIACTNISAFFTPEFFLNNGSETVTEDHNLTFSADPAWTHPSGTGDVYADPLFVSTTVGATGAFQIQAGSPARNAGTTTPAYFDALGVSRPQGAAFDIGAFEIVGVTANAPANTLFFAAGLCLLLAFGASLFLHARKKERNHRQIHARETITLATVEVLKELGTADEVLNHPCRECGELLYVVRDDDSEG